MARNKTSSYYREVYLAYEKKYESTKKLIDKRYGAKPFQPKMTEKQFIINFDVERMSDEMKKNRWSGKRIAQEMAKDDVYQFTKEEGRKFSRVEIEGRKITYLEARARGSEIESIIVKRNQELEMEGVGSTARAKIVGQEFFGSE